MTSYFASIVEDRNRPGDLSEDRQKTSTANSSDAGNRARCLDGFPPVTSERSVEKHLRSIDTSKASGSDGISWLLLKHCAPVLAPSLTRIFNTSIVTGTVPHLFKKATITTIHKSGDKSQAGNYRPISLLPILSKILEKVVSTQFKEYLNDINFFLLNSLHTARVTLLSCHPTVVNRESVRPSAASASNSLTFSQELASKGLLWIGLSVIVVSRWGVTYPSVRWKSALDLAGCPKAVSCMEPLLFTLYTRHLPALLTIQCAMFADDILLFFSFPSQQNCARVIPIIRTQAEKKGREAELGRLGCIGIASHSPGTLPNIQRMVSDDRKTPTIRTGNSARHTRKENRVAIALFFRRKQSRMLGKKESKSDGELRRKHWYCIYAATSGPGHMPRQLPK